MDGGQGQRLGVLEIIRSIAEIPPAEGRQRFGAAMRNSPASNSAPAGVRRQTETCIRGCLVFSFIDNAEHAGD
ncbi:hypothetical protein Thiowin_01408 [Thiorhodovibrio winogradskyi]|uniref:Uncharacterized protein n=1 Tax=Thiorhodovibrio winogradskyi TaxID=77007 RepID=A0ABZ0S826_9GAMM